MNYVYHVLIWNYILYLDDDRVSSIEGEDFVFAISSKTKPALKITEIALAFRGESIRVGICI